MTTMHYFRCHASCVHGQKRHKNLLNQKVLLQDFEVLPTTSTYQLLSRKFSNIGLVTNLTLEVSIKSTLLCASILKMLSR